MLFHAGARPVQRAWTEQFGAAAVLCAALPLWNMCAGTVSHLAPAAAIRCTARPLRRDATVPARALFDLVAMQRENPRPAARAMRERAPGRLHCAWHGDCP